MTTQTSDPYQTPQSQVNEVSNTSYGEVKLFSFSGRIGRLRYLGYNAVISILFFVLFALMGGMTVALAEGQDPGAINVIAGILMIGLYLFVTVVSIALAIRRLNDFDASGWLSLLMFVPLVNMIFLLVLWFVPGTSGENRYGLQPPPNTILVAIMGILMPLIVIGGILAAIAIPAYQGYVERAAVMQEQ